MAVRASCSGSRIQGQRWYPAALAAAVEVELPSGARIRAVSPDCLLATKLEAFHARGEGDFLASVDFEDIVRLVDGRSELVAEVLGAPDDVRSFIAEAVAGMFDEQFFETGVAGALLRDEVGPARLPLVLERLRAIAATALRYE